MSGLTQVSSLGCNLHLFYPSFVLSAGPEPGKQIAAVLVFPCSLASVVENGKRMRERGWGCGRKAFWEQPGRNAVVASTDQKFITTVEFVPCLSIFTPSYRQH